jgi:transposase
LGVIGINEIALTKGRRNFFTTQQADGHVAVLAVLSDRKKKTVKWFLDTTPQRLWSTLDTTCTDTWEGYVNALKEFAAAHSKVSLNMVVDRYHVAKNCRACVGKMRKQERRRLKKKLPTTEHDENVKGQHLNILGRFCRSRDFHIAPTLRGMETSATPHVIEKIHQRY